MSTQLIRSNADLQAISSSFIPSYKPEKKKLYAALTNTSGLKSAVGLELQLSGVLVMPNQQFTDEETGELFERDVFYLVTDKGNFATNSASFKKELALFFALFGEPASWKTEMAIKIGQKKVKNGDVLTLEAI